MLHSEKAEHGPLITAFLRVPIFPRVSTPPAQLKTSPTVIWFRWKNGQLTNHGLTMNLRLRARMMAMVAMVLVMMVMVTKATMTMTNSQGLQVAIGIINLIMCRYIPQHTPAYPLILCIIPVTHCIKGILHTFHPIITMSILII